MINISKVCHNCGGLFVGHVVTEDIDAQKISQTCDICGVTVTMLANRDTRKLLYLRAIEEAIFGLWIESDFDLERVDKIVNEIKRLNAIETRANQYLAVTKSPVMQNGMDIWARLIVKHIFTDHILNDGGVIEY